MIQILVGGDVCPVGKVQDEFSDGNAQGLFHDLLEEIAINDLSIVNLECPLVSEKTPVMKVGEVLGADIGCIRGFVAANWKVLNLANNHVLDHGPKGLLETIRTIEQSGLEHVGVGSTLRDAQIPLVKEIQGRRIVIYAMAEREFSIAGARSAGANPLDIMRFVSAVRTYKDGGVFIVLIHGGNEYYPYPSPEMARRCRFMVDMGADAVICCHTHCPLPWETYAGRPIAYGLGNLIFDGGLALGEKHREPESWHIGYLAKLLIENDQVRMETIPYRQSQGFLGAKRMDEVARTLFLSEMQAKAAELRDVSRLEHRWEEYCGQQKNTYLAALFGYNRVMRKAARLLLKRLHSKKDVLRALHLAQCEAHQEVLCTILRGEIEGGLPKP
jgi:hypothetical protein